MQKRPKIGIIISTTRPGRFADVPTNWLFNIAKQRDDANFEIVDLRDYPMPFFEEKMALAYAPTQNEAALRWEKKIASLDGYIFVTAEYNHSIPAVLKNALDYLYSEIHRKPATFVGYGGTGGSRAVEHLRHIAIELQMVSTHAAVYLGGGDFMAVHPAFGNKPIEAVEANLLPAAKTALDDLVWWTRATMVARAVEG